jgi:hypothetical protein
MKKKCFYKIILLFFITLINNQTLAPMSLEQAQQVIELTKSILEKKVQENETFAIDDCLYANLFLMLHDEEIYGNTQSMQIIGGFLGSLSLEFVFEELKNDQQFNVSLEKIFPRRFALEPHAPAPFLPSNLRSTLDNYPQPARRTPTEYSESPRYREAPLSLSSYRARTTTTTTQSSPIAIQRLDRPMIKNTLDCMIRNNIFEDYLKKREINLQLLPVSHIIEVLVDTLLRGSESITARALLYRLNQILKSANVESIDEEIFNNIATLSFKNQALQNNECPLPLSSIADSLKKISLNDPDEEEFGLFAPSDSSDNEIESIF